MIAVMILIGFETRLVEAYKNKKKGIRILRKFYYKNPSLGPAFCNYSHIEIKTIESCDFLSQF